METRWHFDSWELESRRELNCNRPGYLGKFWKYSTPYFWKVYYVILVIMITGLSRIPTKWSTNGGRAAGGGATWLEIGEFFVS